MRSFVQNLESPNLHFISQKEDLCQSRNPTYIFYHAPYVPFMYLVPFFCILCQKYHQMFQRMSEDAIQFANKDLEGKFWADL